MDSSSANAVLMISLLSVATTVGALVIARWGRAASLNPVIAPGIAAGVMLWLALGEVAPGSLGSNGLAVTIGAMGGGVVAVVVIDRLVSHTVRWGAGVAPVIGAALALHDLPEGFAVASLLSAGGLAVALPMLVAVAAHNLPEKLAFIGPAENENLPRWAVLLVATLPEPLGAVVAAVGAGVAPAASEVAVAVAGGMMLAVALGSLPSLARQACTMRSFTVAGAGGAGAMAMLGVVLPG